MCNVNTHTCIILSTHVLLQLKFLEAGRGQYYVATGTP